MTYHRLEDTNHSLYGPTLNTAFEACFVMATSGELFLSGRILDSENKEVFCSRDLTDLDESMSEAYKKWRPTKELETFIQDVKNLTLPSEESLCFMAPIYDICLEVKLAPTCPKGYLLSIHLSHFSIFGNYKWIDSGTISVNMICEGQAFINFLGCLKSDLEILLSEQ